MKIAGLDRKLPICKLNDDISIAGFIMFGDAELTVAAAAEILKKVPEFDVIVTAEAKGIPLAHELSRQSGKKYVVCRKTAKLYMVKPVIVPVKTISTAADQTLILDEPDLLDLWNKRVLIADDVVSTGGAMLALESLVQKAGGEIVAKATVLAEGDAADRKDLIYLEKLPLFKTTKEEDR